MAKKKIIENDTQPTMVGSATAAGRTRLAFVGLFKNVKTNESNLQRFLRLALALIVLGLIGAAGYWLWTTEVAVDERDEVKLIELEDKSEQGLFEETSEAFKDLSENAENDEERAGFKEQQAEETFGGGELEEALILFKEAQEMYRQIGDDASADRLQFRIEAVEGQIRAAEFIGEGEV